MTATRARATSPAAVVTVLGAVAVAGGVAVVGMWWQDTAAGSLRSLGDELTAVGRLTGLVGAYLVLVQMLLMGRLPWLERSIGMDRLARWHGRNGQYVIGLLVTHTIAIVAGYALADRVAVTTETGNVVRSYPDVLAATVALGLLVAVGITSARAARRRLAYHTWYFLHLYTYLAVVLAFAHQLATGNEFVGHPGHRVFWVVLHVGTAALLLGYRVAVPALSALRHRLRVEHVTVEAPGIVSMYVTGRSLADLGAQSGQFFLWRFLTPQGWWQAHPFSLSAAPNPRFLRITVKAVGDHTTGLRGIRPGTRVVAEGPYGMLTEARRTRRKVLLLAGGIGVTPLRALFETLTADAGAVTFLYRATTEDDLVLRRELEELAHHRTFRLAYLLGPRDQQPDPLGPDRLRAEVTDLADHDVYVCGPPAFVDHAITMLRAAGVPRRHVHAERFEL